MKLKFGLLCFLFCCSCIPKNKTQVFNQNNVHDIKLIDAKYENWVAGNYGGGSGVEYYINAVINTNPKIRAQLPMTVLKNLFIPYCFIIF